MLLSRSETHNTARKRTHSSEDYVALFSNRLSFIDLIYTMGFFSPAPQGLVDSTSTGSDSDLPTSPGSVVLSSQGLPIFTLQDSTSSTAQDSTDSTAQDSTGSAPQDLMIPASQDPSQDSTLPSSKGSTISSPNLSVVSISQVLIFPSSGRSHIPTFDESTAQISQITDLIQNIKEHVSGENTTHTQASLDHIILHVTNLVLNKQIHLQELENKCVEIEKKNHTISTLRGEFDVKDTTISN
jgi:hypothetical protein